MHVTRIYDKGGEAHFQDLDICFESQEPGAYSSVFPTEGLFFRRFAAGLKLGYHTAPRRQWFIVVSGVFEVDGANETRRFKPGDIVFVEDTTGKGHTARNLEGDRILAYLPAPKGFDISQVTAFPAKVKGISA